MFFSNPASESVARPFAPPLWAAGDAPPALHVTLSEKETETSFEWNWATPETVTLKGDVYFSTPPASSQLELVLPDGEKIVLADMDGQARSHIDIDGRDLDFRQKLGLEPFDDAMKLLFPLKGRYRLTLTGDFRPDSVDMTLSAPGGTWGALGTDQRGRDVLHLLLLGVRVSLLVGISATLLASFIGLSVGLTSGYVGGAFDSLVMRFVDLLLSIPVLPILMVIVGIWGRGLWQLVLVLGLFSWMGSARTIRSMVLSLREACYVENLRSIGAPTRYILFRHLLPEALPLLLATVTLGVPGAILAEAGLSFLGLSDPRIVSWGRMLHEAHGFGAFTAGAWWLILPPGLGIALICLIFLDIGRALEEKAGPRLSAGGRK